MSKRLIKTIIYALGILVITSTASAQNSNRFDGQISNRNLKKLDPRFQRLAAEGRPDMRRQASYPRPLSGAVNENGEATYGAIVYLTDITGLKAADFEVNSDLGDFVTLRLTAPEILRLAEIEDVQYITPGDINYPANHLTSGTANSVYLNGSFPLVDFSTGPPLLFPVTYPDFNINPLIFQDKSLNFQAN